MNAIEVSLDNVNYSSIDGVLFNKESSKLICYPAGRNCEYVIPNSVSMIGNSAFSSCHGLTSVTIPNSVTSIGDDTFSYCHGLTSVTIPNSVTSIGDYAFYYCGGLTSIIIPNSVTSIGKQAFYECRNLSSATLPNSVTSIGGHAFCRCSSLTSVTLPNSVTSIGNGAFSNCSSLTSVTIPNSVTSIGGSAFFECPNLTDVISYISNPFDISYNVFSTKGTATLRVPTGTTDKYRAAKGWRDFINIVEDENLGIDEAPTFDDDAPMSVYNVSGILLKSNCTKDELNSLPGGWYILVSGNKRVKVNI